jgi:hypothetical protein
MPPNPGGHPDHESVRLVLDLDLEGNPPRGWLVDEEGSVRAFFGWLQLMDGLENARQHASPRGLAPKPTEGPERAD